MAKYKVEFTDRTVQGISVDGDFCEIKDGSYFIEKKGRVVAMLNSCCVSSVIKQDD